MLLQRAFVCLSDRLPIIGNIRHRPKSGMIRTFRHFPSTVVQMWETIIDFYVPPRKAIKNSTFVEVSIVNNHNEIIVKEKQLGKYCHHFSQDKTYLQHVQCIIFRKFHFISGSSPTIFHSNAARQSRRDGRTLLIFHKFIFGRPDILLWQQVNR